MKVFVVIEDYTCAFYGVFTDKEKAKRLADEIGGSVIECDPTKNAIYL